MTSSFWAYLPSPMATNSVPADHIKPDVPSPFSRAPSDPLRQLEYVEFPLLSSFLSKSNRCGKYSLRKEYQTDHVWFVLNTVPIKACRIHALYDGGWSLDISMLSRLPKHLQNCAYLSVFACACLRALVYVFQNLGEMMTLGMNDAAISPSFIEGLTLEGPVGHTARKIAYLIRLPTDEHRLKVGISWLTKSAIDSVASLQTTLTKVLSGS
ncbi:unnamed protein product [Ilex paraguariensis]|uniref:Uncharacterized protein n=1 Tax=Ilex paraguariensis TaxID=185542 RepID=A0ABC8SVC9_9AQUA